MSLSSGFESNAIGGIGGAGMGGLGMGGFGLFGLLGLRGIGDLDGRRRDGDDDGCAREAAILAAIANAKDASQASALGLAAAVTNAKDQTILEGRGLAAAICDAEKTNMQQFYAAAIQAANNTQAVKDQATAFAIVADKRFDDLAAAGVAQTAAILARINEQEMNSLRDQLNHSHRRADSQDINISIANSNAQLQAQMQQQQQIQTQRDFDHIRRFDSIFGSFNQLNRNTQDVINFGTMAASANQANQQTNVK